MTRVTKNQMGDALDTLNILPLYSVIKDRDGDIYVKVGHDKWRDTDVGHTADYLSNYAPVTVLSDATVAPAPTNLKALHEAASAVVSAYFRQDGDAVFDAMVTLQAELSTIPKGT